MADLIERDYLILKFEDTGKPSISEMGKGYDLGIKAALRVVKNAPAVNRWIPCSERLPENGEKCLVCMADKSIRFGVWFGDFDSWGVWEINKKLYRTITVPYWMPMPEPPEREVQNG